MLDMYVTIIFVCIFKCTWLTLFKIQVENVHCPQVDFGIGERAMLIKDGYGDWGVVTGVWKEFKKGVNGTSRKDEACFRIFSEYSLRVF